jgi:hypothetical protein
MALNIYKIYIKLSFFNKIHQKSRKSGLFTYLQQMRSNDEAINRRWRENTRM